MKYIGELMANLGRVDSNRDYDEEKCKVCGATIRFYQNEYKKPCRECGTWIYQGFKAKKSHETRVKCFICMDKGIVEYTVQKRGILYKHVARCDCPKGMEWPDTIPLLKNCKDSPRAEVIRGRNKRRYGTTLFLP